MVCHCCLGGQSIPEVIGQRAETSLLQGRQLVSAANKFAQALFLARGCLPFFRNTLKKGYRTVLKRFHNPL
jgi:hypothetical protein